MTGNFREENKKKKFDFLSLILVVLIVAVSVAGINCYIEQYEKNYRNEVLSEKLKQAKNENDRLMIEYQRRTNYLTVEEYATKKLGLKKINSYQIEYIDRGNVNTVELTENGDDENSFTDDIAKVFSVILEYFN